MVKGEGQIDNYTQFCQINHNTLEKNLSFKLTLIWYSQSSKWQIINLIFLNLPIKSNTLFMIKQITYCGDMYLYKKPSKHLLFDIGEG
jgi:hypothetical protein